MKFFVILTLLHLLVVTRIACSSNIGSKEINGKRAKHNRLHIKGEKDWAVDDKYKYVVMITWNMFNDRTRVHTKNEIGKVIDDSLYYKCSGVIIAPAWVITSASCFQPKVRTLNKKKGTYIFLLRPDEGAVLFNGQNRSMETLYIHEDYEYNSRRGDVDIVLINLKEEFIAGSFKVARLSKNFDYSPYTDRNNMRDCIIVGYGEDGCTAEPPFTQKLTMIDVRAAGPKFCDILQRRLMCPKYEKYFPWANYKLTQHDMFDGFYICTSPHKWVKGEGDLRPPENEKGLGCYGAGGSALICDIDNVLVGVQSRRFGTYYCEDEKSYTSFTSVGDDRVYDWIKTFIPDIGPKVSFKDTQYAYNLRVDSEL